MLDLMWNVLQKELKDLRQGLKVASTLSERAETAGGVASSTLANAPLAADGAGAGDLLWISDGRKAAEGAGDGTGVLAVYNPATDQWLRASDNVAVVV